MVCWAKANSFQRGGAARENTAPRGSVACTTHYPPGTCIGLSRIFPRSALILSRPTPIASGEEPIDAHRSDIDGIRLGPAEQFFIEGKSRLPFHRHEFVAACGSWSAHGCWVPLP
jgi:hypothetical protein